MNETCGYCGKELEFIDCEWAKYNFADCEEIVSVYGCKACNKKYTQREGNFRLECNGELE